MFLPTGVVEFNRVFGKEIIAEHETRVNERSCMGVVSLINSLTCTEIAVVSHGCLIKDNINVNFHILLTAITELLPKNLGLSLISPIKGCDRAA